MRSKFGHVQAPSYPGCDGRAASRKPALRPLTHAVHPCNVHLLQMPSLLNSQDIKTSNPVIPTSRSFICVSLVSPPGLCVPLRVPA